jgi:small subunit ribosomal protein S17
LDKEQEIQRQDQKELPKRGKRKVFEGKVIGDRMEKTRVILLETRYRHPLYEKIMKRRNKIYAHDEENASKMGDTVQVMETRPLSKTKRWRIVKKIS